MGIVKLEKIRLFGVRSESEPFLEELQKLGVVEIRRVDEEHYKKNRLESVMVLQKLEKLLPVLESLINQKFSEKMKIRYISETDFFPQQSQKFEDNVQFIEKIDAVYHELFLGEAKIQDLSEQIDILEVVKNFDIPPECLKDTAYTSTILGRVPDSVHKSLFTLAQNFPFDFDVISQSDGFIYFIGFYYKDFTRHIMDEIKLLEFQEWAGPFPQEGSFRGLFRSLINERHQLAQRIDDLKIQMRIFSQETQKIQVFFDFLSNRVQKDLVRFHLTESPFLFEMQAYIPLTDIPALDALLKRFPGCDYEIAELAEGEETPSLIRNTAFSRPFEFVTDMYSRPGKEDVDPTPFFAPFFAVFMGIAIGDAGQGILLAAFSYFARHKMRISDSAKKMLGVCFYGGIMSIVIGILTGTYFAIPFEDFGIHIPLLYKPEKQVMLALSISFVCGFIHITFGYFIRFFHLLSSGRIFDAIFDGLTHIVVMLCGFMTVLGVSIPSLKFLLPIATYIFIVDIIAIWATAGRHFSDAFLGRVLWGLYGVYELTSIFGDLLSYARLFALGLAGGIIGSAINQLTPALITGIHFGSVGSSIYAIIMIILFVVILVVGHAFTMVIGILGAFIHTMRLQFVEFFGKFFQGGGRAFRPFQIESKYIWIQKYKQTIEK